MKKILLIIFFYACLILGLLKINSVFAASENAPLGYIVKAYIIVPSDRVKPPSVLEKYKSNALKGLEDAKQFYASKLQGHTFSYSPEVKIINADKGISSLNLRKIACPSEVVDALGINLPTDKVLNVIFVMGVDLSVDCGFGNLNGGSAWFSEDNISKLGSNKWALGHLMHELAHAFGLINAGWSGNPAFAGGLGHPCSIESQQECKRGPQGLGTTIPYPPASQARYSIVGSGADYLDGPDASRVGFNDTESSPEVQELYKSPFINPNQDPAPPPTSQSGGSKPSGEITDITPNNIKEGDTVKIIGNGFGDGKDGWLDFYTYPRPNVKLKSWTNSQIEVTITSIEQDYPTEFKFSVRKGKDQIYTPQTLTISRGKRKLEIDSVTPSSVEVGKDLVIIGRGLQDGPIRISNPASELPVISNFRVNQHSDSQISISILEGPSKPTTYNVDILATSGETLISIPIQIRPLNSQPATTISNIDPSQVYPGDKFNITGLNFGNQAGRLDFVDSTGTLKFSGYGYSWSDKKITVSISDSSYTSDTTLNVSVITTSGVKVLSPVKLILKVKNIPTPTLQFPQILSLYPNPITVGALTIGGTGFGNDKGVITFSGPSGTFSTLSDYFEVRKWTDNEIVVYIAKPLSSITQSWVMSVETKTGNKVNTVLTINSIPTPPPSALPGASSIASASPSPSPGQASTVSASPSAGACLPPPQSVDIVDRICVSPRRVDPKLDIAICDGKLPDCSPNALVKRTDGSLFCLDQKAKIIVSYANCPSSTPTPPVPSSPLPVIPVASSTPTARPSATPILNPLPSAEVSPIPSLPTSSQQPSPNPAGNQSQTAAESPTASPVAKKRQITKITVNVVEGGYIMEVSPLTFSSPPSIRLPVEMGLRTYHVIVNIEFDDKSLKSVPFIFHYKGVNQSSPSPIPQAGETNSSLTQPSVNPTPTPSLPTPLPNSSILKAEGLGTCYTNPSYDSNICPSIFRSDKGGAGGQCGQENAGKTVNVPCQKTCANGNIAYGNTVSTCQQDGCYHNDSCSCDAVCTGGNLF